MNESSTRPLSGPCQFPTLGFVVSRYNQVKSFVPETFWYIYVALSREGEEEQETPFTWKRGHLFEFEVAVALYEHVLAAPEARVTKVVTKNTKKWKPLPLTTVDLQKAGSRLLKISPKNVLDVSSVAPESRRVGEAHTCPLRGRSRSVCTSRASCLILVRRRTDTILSSISGP